ncbi:unnamed protein product [Orchesella dallaii]|uniref:Fibrinogen C-terminal domain-containing protein n=1 Tax=Orchesella dallaii TaxID=48710 RepID=A0ABP1PMP9_9HEXA
MLCRQILLSLFLILISTWKPILSQSIEGSSDLFRYDILDVSLESAEIEFEDSTPFTTNITIFLVGRNGSGVLSTIREILGPNTNCQAPQGTDTSNTLVEYTLKVPSSSEIETGYNIKLAALPEFVDGRPSELDGRILASMKSYIYQNGIPDYYLALSTISDYWIDDEDSSFVQFLNHIELFQRTYIGTPRDDNIVFLLTKLMSERIGRQRRPETKISMFREVIEDYTSYRGQSITAIVGENNAGKDFNAPIEGGYYRLPNGQHYPKNIWDALINITSNDNRDGFAKKQILATVMNSRESNNVTCEARAVSTSWFYYDDDVHDYLYLLQQSNITVQENEVNDKIQHEFNKASSRTKEQCIVQKLALQLRLQNMNITTENDLPKTPSQQTALYHSNRFSSGVSAMLLAEAFNMQMPEYSKSLHVGYGYDLIADEIIPESPFRIDALSPSDVGYELPNFLNCRQLFEPDIKYYKSYSQHVSDYIEERLKYLDFDGKENASDYELDFQLKEGFNLKLDDDSNELVTLSAFQEIRTVKCTLEKENLHLLLNENMLEAINSMSEFDCTKIASVNEWTSFFFKFGSHIVTESFGGGIMYGSLVGSNLTNILVSENSINSVLNSIVQFTNFSANLQPPTYRIYGGNPNVQLYNPYDLSNDTRKLLLNAWTESLRSDFVMLNYELGLEPISAFIKPFNQEKGEFVEKAIELLLRGDLKYARKVSGSRTGRLSRRLTTKRSSETCQPADPKQNHAGNHHSYSNVAPGPNINPVQGHPRTCEQIQLSGMNSSGVYHIYPFGMERNGTEVYCDLHTDMGGWTVIQRRNELSGKQVNFYRSWEEYAVGFGITNGSYWLGLNTISELTKSGEVELQIELTDWEDNDRVAKYAYFRIANSSEKFRLVVADYSGNAGDSLAVQNGMAFTTKDLDNDLNAINNCARQFSGAWWYAACHESNLNGLYMEGKHASYANGVNWHTWLGHHYSLKRTDMKIRSRHFEAYLRVKGSGENEQ